MSLARIALRMAAVEALKGRTLVGANVLDSPNGALDIQADGSLRTEADKPFVSVYTDVGKAEHVAGRSMIENGVCDIVFEMGASAAMLTTDQRTGETTFAGISIPASDTNFEFFLDIVQRQIGDALTDPGNVWAEIYRGLHFGITKIEFAGARNADDGHRLVGHQMRVSVQLIDDPLTGEPLVDDTPFAQFLVALAASDDPDHVTQAQTMRSVLAGQNLPWQTLWRRHGRTADEMAALGLVPLAVMPDGDAPVMASSTVIVEPLP